MRYNRQKSAKIEINGPINQQKELAEYLSADSTKVTYKSLNCLQGHDSFLVDIETFSREISCYLENI